MAQRKKFDLSSMMESMSGLLAINQDPRVQMIPLEDIVDNPANFYKVDKAELEKLADSIAIDGLQQYPVVMSHPKQAGKFLLISGHRRCAALRLLVDGEDQREDLRMVPCIVRQYQSEAMAELQLILANSTSRKLGNDEISKQAARLEILLYQLKEEGYEFPGRMRDQVAAACQVSGPKLARLKVIREKLKAPEFLLLYEKDKLSEQAAYALARLPEEFQARVARIKPDISGAVADRMLKQYESGWRWEPELSCPDGKACRRGDSFLRHDLECYFDMCGGQKCCLYCERATSTYSPCDRMCSKANRARKDVRDAEKEKEEAERQKQIKRNQLETQKNAQRLLPAIEASGLHDEDTIRWGYCTFSLGEIKMLAAGEFSDSVLWHGVKLSLGSLSNPAEVSNQLGCSSDYLLGLTDELYPPTKKIATEDAVPDEIVEQLLEDVSVTPKQVCPVWLPGTPEESGPVVARFVEDGLNDILVCWYEHSDKSFRSINRVVKWNRNCTGWWPIPDDAMEGAL